MTVSNEAVDLDVAVGAVCEVKGDTANGRACYGSKWITFYVLDSRTVERMSV